MKKKQFLIVASLIILYSSPSIAGCSRDQIMKMINAGFSKSEIEKICSSNLSDSSASNDADSIERSAEEKDFFDVFFSEVGLQNKISEELFPQLSQSSAGQIHSLLDALPEAPNEVHEDSSYKEKYRYIQVMYENYFFSFVFGNEKNKWKDKLYKFAFNLRYPNENITEDETGVFRKLMKLYGDYTRKEKFQNSLRISSNLNFYVWELTDIIVTYRSFYDSRNIETTVVVEYWNKEFYNTHDYSRNY